jgi:hypothetical protein
MRLRRLHHGELLALAGAAGLLVTLFLTWFEASFPRLSRSGWGSLGWFLDALLVLAIGLALWLAVATAGNPPSRPAQSVTAAVLTATVGTIVFAVLAVRVIDQPGLGHDVPNELISIQAPAYLGLACCAAIAAGGWLSIRDERTDAPESAYEPPPARPAPPAG